MTTTVDLTVRILSHPAVIRSRFARDTFGIWKECLGNGERVAWEFYNLSFDDQVVFARDAYTLCIYVVSKWLTLMEH